MSTLKQNINFEGFSISSLSQLQFLVDYAQEKLLPDTAEAICEAVEILGELEFDKKIRARCADFLDAAFKFIDKESVIEFLRQEATLMSEENFEKEYGIKSADDLIFKIRPTESITKPTLRTYH